MFRDGGLQRTPASLRDAQRRGDGRGHSRAVGGGRQRHEDDTARERRASVPSRLQRQPGLAAPARTRDGQQAYVIGMQQAGEVPQLTRAADQRGARRRKMDARAGRHARCVR